MPRTIGERHPRPVTVQVERLSHEAMSLELELPIFRKKVTKRGDGRGSRLMVKVEEDDLLGKFYCDEIELEITGTYKLWRFTRREISRHTLAAFSQWDAVDSVKFYLFLENMQNDLHMAKVGGTIPDVPHST